MDIIDRLNDEELYVDAVDDAALEIRKLRGLLKLAYPLIDDTFLVKHTIERYFGELSGECPHGWEEWDDCPVCCH